MAWSTVSTAFELSLKNFTPLGLLMVASLTALGIITLLRLFISSPIVSSKISIITHLKLSFIPGLLNPLVYYLVLLVAYDRLPAQEAQVLNYTWAIILALLSVAINKERFRSRDLIALVLSLLGVLIISSKGRISSFRFEDPLGTALALGSSLIWASYWIINMRDKRDGLIKLYYNFLIGSVFILLIVIFGHAPLLREGLKPQLTTLIPAIYVGIFEMGLTFFLWLKALGYSKSTADLSNLIFVTPFISLVFIALILKESIAPATIIGLILIVGSNLYQKMGIGRS